MSSTMSRAVSKSSTLSRVDTWVLGALIIQITRLQETKLVRILKSFRAQRYMEVFTSSLLCHFMASK